MWLTIQTEFFDLCLAPAGTHFSQSPIPPIKYQSLQVVARQRPLLNRALFQLKLPLHPKLLCLQTWHAPLRKILILPIITLPEFDMEKLGESTICNPVWAMDMRVHLSKYYPQSSPLCFRGCGHLGSLPHTLCEYPRIRGYWNKIFNLIHKTTGIVVKWDPTIALLNSRIPKVPKSTQALIHFIFLGAKMTIVRTWKSPSVSYHLTKQKNLLDNVSGKNIQHHSWLIREIQTYQGTLG